MKRTPAAGFGRLPEVKHRLQSLWDSLDVAVGAGAWFVMLIALLLILLSFL